MHDFSGISTPWFQFWTVLCPPLSLNTALTGRSHAPHDPGEPAAWSGLNCCAFACLRLSLGGPGDASVVAAALLPTLFCPNGDSLYHRRALKASNIIIYQLAATDKWVERGDGVISPWRSVSLAWFLIRAQPLLALTNTQHNQAHLYSNKSPPPINTHNENFPA